MKKKIVLASSNKGKLQEIKAVIQDPTIELHYQSDLGVKDAEETGKSFIENAIIKARNACEITGLPSIADDSGLEVDILDGQPGIFSARYSSVSGPNADEANNKKLLSALAGVPIEKRIARFYCAIAYLRFASDPTPLICLGSWEGSILDAPIGENGFGYDPLFYVKTHQCSSAELLPEIKNSISHRAIALKRLKKLWPSRR
jgi:XTP/dITP diphosphohydrolase